MWFTPTNGRCQAKASDLAAATPTSSAPTRPGPMAAATASMRSGPTPAVRSASSTMGSTSSRCARLAISGTTPP